ncbi:MAG: PfkB family carbohydrate kinase [Chitinophagaceae bacterium]
MKKIIKTCPINLSPAKIAFLLNAIKEDGTKMQEKKITAGFDGFIDTIIKIIKKKQPQKTSLFTTIKEFGNYILEKEGTSFSLELEEQHKKLGGNMPIMANALGQMGIPVNCLGALGYPQPDPIFKNFSLNCKLFSFADPGISTAYEFNDGKILLAQMGELNNTDWKKIKEKIGLDTVITLYKESNLICLLNWSEIDASTDIWKGILKDVLPKYSPGKEQIAFFDLSDCSKRTHQSITEALDLIQRFAKYTKVILSLNKNEAHIIYQSLYNKKSKKELFSIGNKILERLAIDTLVLHSSKEAMAFSNSEKVKVDSFFTPKPKISTGAGDNFNAGFCAGQLLELDLESSLILANAVSGWYIRKGISPQLPDIVDFLKNISVSN